MNLESAVRRLALVLVVALATAGCATDAPDEPAQDGTPEADSAPPSEEDSSSEEESSTDDDGDTDGTEDSAANGGESGADVDDLEFTRCESEDVDVDYPSTWTVYEDEEVPPCRVFHPEQIEDFEGESLHYAVRLYIDPVALEDATENPFGEELSREEHTVDGRDAVTIERRSDGEDMLPEGERRYTYVVDLSDDAEDPEHALSLIATTTSVGDTDYELDRRVLDRMMESLTVDVAGEA